MNNVYEIVTNRIIELLNQGVIPWHKPWQANGKLAVNAITNKPYRGVNQMLLAGCPYESNKYVSRLQIEQHGGKVLENMKPSFVVFYCRIEEKDKDGQVVVNDKGDVKTYSILRYYHVYNAAQVEGIEYSKIDNGGDIQLVEPVKIVDSMPNRPAIKHENCKKAFYSPSNDYVNMPEARFFYKPEEYYSTLFHELAHSTGHASRIGRTGVMSSWGKDSKQYAYEELVAEMSAGFLCGRCGIESTVENHAAYVQSWLKAFESNKKMVVMASGSAQKAVGYITNDLKEAA